MKKIILASGSPRRQMLLQQIGLDFVSSPANIDEDLTNITTPTELASDIAFRKARQVARHLDQGIIVAADTVVVWEGRIMGKPNDREDAFRMLDCLNGCRHQVITGLCVWNAETNIPEVAAEPTAVFFRSLTPQEINRYLDYGEWEDKAGGYAIQGRGALLVDHIEGCYFNVVGLPLNRLHLMLRKQGVDLLGVD